MATESTDIIMPNPEDYIPKLELPPKLKDKDIKVVFCFSIPKGKFFFMPDRKILYPKFINGKLAAGEWLPAVTIFNEKTKKWEDYPYVDYIEACIICEHLMRVFAIQGTTWFALCSEECYDKFSNKMAELEGSFSNALKFYMKY